MSRYNRILCPISNQIFILEDRHGKIHIKQCEFFIKYYNEFCQEFSECLLLNKNCIFLNSKREFYKKYVRM